MLLKLLNQLHVPTKSVTNYVVHPYPSYGSKVQHQQTTSFPFHKKKKKSNAEKIALLRCLTQESKTYLLAIPLPR